MKTKKMKHESSSEESDESRESVESISSSSDSESDVSSTLERRHKRKRKRANPSESDSDSEVVQKRAKKRKHKKKKKKHMKRKRHVESDDSGSEAASSASNGEISSKKKKKYKHKQKYTKKSHGSLDSNKEYSDSGHEDRRLQSVVKERKSSEGSQPSRPSRTYYHKEYQRSPSVLQYRNQNSEVERFYHGSSKDRTRGPYEQEYYNRNDERFENQYNQERYDRNRERNEHEYRGPNNSFHPRVPREYDEYNRPARYDSRDPPNDRQYQRKPQREEYMQNQGYNRYNQEGRVDMRRPEEPREFRPRSGPPPYDRFRDQNYGDKRAKFNETTYPDDRSGEARKGRYIDQDRNRQISPVRREIRSPRIQDKEAKGEHTKYNRNEERIKDRVIGKEIRGEVGRDEKADRPRPPPVSIKKSPPERAGPSGRDRDARRDSRPDFIKRDKAHSPKGTGYRERKSRFNEADDKNYTWGKTTVKQEDKDPAEKEKPNFGLSGKLTADVNTVNGVVIKYTEPDDAKQPKRRWRFYPFKGDKALPILFIHRQSCFVLGRDKKVVDIHLEHPSVSKQHAALQYRATAFTRPDGTQGRRVRPYIIDLDSANGTFVNNKKIDPRRYVELLERDVVKFGFSQREYVLLHENSKDDALDDDHHDPLPGVTTTDQIKQEKRTKMEIAADGD